MVWFIPKKKAWYRTQTDNTDEVLEYDKDVNKQEIIPNEIGNEAISLFGTSLWFGRSIRFNPKFFFKVFQGRQDAWQLTGHL